MDSKLYKEIGKTVENAKKNGGSLTEQNLMYVVKVATDMSNKSGMDFEELLGEGVTAMKKAEEKYDPTQNDTFIKYAGPAIRGYMLNLINRQGNLVHIPVNHLKGFKRGQEKVEDANIKYEFIDSIDYDTLGMVDNDAFKDDRDNILQDGLNKLDSQGRTVMEMKLRLGKYGELTRSDEDPDKMVYKYKNNIDAIANELEVTVPRANKIYKEAMKKLSSYCQAMDNE